MPTVYDHRYNNVFTFPEGTTEDEIRATVQQIHSQADSGRESGLGSMAADLVANLAPRATTPASTLSGLSGADVWGMTPQQTNATQDRIQSSNIERERNIVAERERLRQAQQAEKKRSDELKLAQQQQRNWMAEYDLQERSNQHAQKIAERQVGAQEKSASASAKNANTSADRLQFEKERAGYPQQYTHGNTMYNVDPQTGQVTPGYEFPQQPQWQLQRAPDGSYVWVDPVTKQVSPETGIPAGGPQIQIPTMQYEAMIQDKMAVTGLDRAAATQSVNEFLVSEYGAGNVAIGGGPAAGGGAGVGGVDGSDGLPASTMNKLLEMYQQAQMFNNMNANATPLPPFQQWVQQFGLGGGGQAVQYSGTAGGVSQAADPRYGITRQERDALKPGEAIEDAHRVVMRGQDGKLYELQKDAKGNVLDKDGNILIQRSGDEEVQK